MGMSPRCYPANTWHKSIDMKKGPNLRWSLIQCSGGDEGNRTPDLLTASQALSQLSYAPVRRRTIRELPLRCKDNFGKTFGGGGEDAGRARGRGARDARPCPRGQRRRPPLRRPRDISNNAARVFRFRGAALHSPNGHPCGAGPIIGANRAPARPAISKLCQITGLARELPSMP